MGYATKLTSQHVDIYKDGQYHRRINKEAVSAYVSGDDVVIQLKNGRTELYNARDGSYKKTL